MTSVAGSVWPAHRAENTYIFSWGCWEEALGRLNSIH